MNNTLIYNVLQYLWRKRHEEMFLRLIYFTVWEIKGHVIYWVYFLWIIVRLLVQSLPLCFSHRSSKVTSRTLFHWSIWLHLYWGTGWHTIFHSTYCSTLGFSVLCKHSVTIGAKIINTADDSYSSHSQTKHVKELPTWHLSPVQIPLLKQHF